MCHGGCGVFVHVKNGKVVRIEGDPSIPTNLGTLCPKGIASMQLLYHPNRLKYPLKRVGERGEGKWQRISWDEALDTIAAKLKEVKEKHGPLAIGAGHGTGRMFYNWVIRLLHAIGGVNWFETGLQNCLYPRMTACHLTYGGNYWMVDYYAFGGVFPRTVVLWGVHPPYANDNGQISTRLREALETGKSRLIVVDTRHTSMAKEADVWLPVRPGTDAAMALAWINVIIAERLYDEDFVKRRTNGPYLVRSDNGKMLTEKDLRRGGGPSKYVVWDPSKGLPTLADAPGVDPALLGAYQVKGIECKPAFQLLADRVAPFTPEKAAEITWVSADRIRSAARTYATSKPSCIQWGNALDLGINSVQTARAISLLPALTKNFEVPGSNILTPDVPPIAICYDINPGYDLVPQELHEKRLGADKFKLGGGPRSVLPSAHIPTMMRAIITGKPYPVRAMIIMGGNYVVGTADAKRLAYEALKSLDFLVVADMFMTPTAELADIVLPAASWIESNRIMGWPSRARAMIMFMNRAIEPLWECKQDEDICIAIAKRMGVGEKYSPWNSVDEYNEWSCKKAGYNWQEIRYNGHIMGKKAYEQYHRIKSPTGKIEIYSNVLLELGYDPLPLFIEPAESPYSTPELVREYPLVLTTGGRVDGFFHSEHRQLPLCREMWPYPTLEINTETAKGLGIEDGDWVWIETPRGRTRQRASLTEGIHPRVVNAQSSWWYPEIETPDHGAWESNINVCTDADHCDPIIGSSTLRGMLCKVYKAIEGPPKGIMASPEALKKWSPQPP